MLGAGTRGGRGVCSALIHVAAREEPSLLQYLVAPIVMGGKADGEGSMERLLPNSRRVVCGRVGRGFGWCAVRLSTVRAGCG